MRAVWVTVEPPDRRLGGGNIRQSHLLRALAGAADTELVLLGPLADDDLRSHLAAVTELPAIAPLAWRTAAGRRWYDLRQALVGGEPAEVALERHRRQRLAPVVGDLVRADLVFFEHAYLGPLAPAVNACRTAVGFQTVPSRNIELALPHAAGARQRWLLARDLPKAQRFESAMAEGIDVVVAVSDQDAARLPPGAIVIPNGVDVSHYVPAPLPAEPRIVMTATFGYEPNVDGAIWFCEQVLPGIRERVPGAELDLVGRLPRAEVRALTLASGVDMHADVPDTLPYLHRARVAVVPVRLGSGTRLKAIEAMAAGRPVVGTSHGLEGLGIEAGRHALVADDPVAFAEAVSSLLVDDERAARLATHGRALVERDFSWDTIGARFVDAVLEGG